MAVNYVEVKTHESGDYCVYLEIVLPIIINNEWISCYKKAVSEASFTTFFSGAPSIDKVSFSGNSIVTNPFSKNSMVMNDAKSFLKELDTQIGRTNEFYARLQKQKEDEFKRAQEQQQKNKEYLQKADDFFNDR